MSLNFLRKTLCFAGLLTLFACNPAYHPPALEICDDWKNSACEESLCSLGNPLPIFWWWIFEDETLNCLESQAIEANPTLDGAAARMNQAYAQASIQYAALFPNINLTPNFYNAGTRLPTFFAIDTTNIPQIAINTPNRVHETLYFFPFTATYDADIWGQNWMTYQAADAMAVARFHQLRQAWLMLTSQVATTYYQIRTIDKQLEVINKTLASRQKSVSLQEERFKKGLIPQMQAAQARVELADVESQKDEQIRLRGIAENYLATLVGAPACSFRVAPDPLCGPPPCVPLSVPSEVLQQRPDMAEAERQLYAANRQIGVAETAMLPSFTLTGQLGFFSSILNQLFEWQSRFWSYAIQVGQIIFDAGGTQANINAAMAAYMDKVSGYRDVALKAFKEVEDGLVNLKAAIDKYEHLSVAVKDAQLVYKLSNERYLKGLTNYLDVMDAERTYLREEQQQVTALGDQYQATISLIEAMGGTW